LALHLYDVFVKLGSVFLTGITMLFKEETDEGEGIRVEQVAARLEALEEVFDFGFIFLEEEAYS
jgi:hypothetical protein